MQLSYKKKTANVLSRFIILCWAVFMSLAAGKMQLQGTGQKGGRTLFQKRLEAQEPHCIGHCQDESCEGQGLLGTEKC